MSEYKPKLTDDMIEAYRRKKNIREDSAYGFYIGVDFARKFYEDNYMKSESTEETNVESSKYKPFNLEECMTKYGGHCVTNAGEAVEILKTDLNGADSEYPVLALATDEYGRQVTRTYTAEGNYTGEENGHTHKHSLRLLVGTEELFLVLVVGPDWVIHYGPSRIYKTLQDAEAARADLRLVPGMAVIIHQVKITR